MLNSGPRVLNALWRLSSVSNINRVPLTICVKRFASNETDAPVKFSSSKAADWKAKYSRQGTHSPNEEAPWFQPWIVISSVSVFMIYFCILREENDIDQSLAVSLYDRIEGLEESNLRISLKHNLDRGLSTTEIRKRLNELENLKGADQENI